MKDKPIYKDERYNYKSFIELYFSFYLKELQEAGLVKGWWYESNTFQLSEPVKGNYLKETKKDIKSTEYHLLQEATITADFTILWSHNAVGLFLLLPDKPISCKITDIPFHIGSITSGDNLYSYVETKGNNESSTSSSISFPYKQKWCFQKHGIFIQKVKPFSYKKQSHILFQDTFTPKEVIRLERYKTDTKWGVKGQSKFKFETRSLENYLKLRDYVN